MYAHIHQEQFQVVRDITFKKPIGVNFIIGSATTFTGKPPSFNVVYLDPETLLPVDLETYAFDLVHANKFDEPKWDLMYDYRKEYNMTDLSPDSFMKLSSDIFYKEEVAIEYMVHRYIGGPGVNPEAGCDFECRMDFYCQTVSNDYDEWQYCRNKDKFDLFGLGDEAMDTVENLINNSWYF